jgi:uncharacterized protein YdaU (DUF1376 family)
MHYYQFNIGDYASHTRHLTNLEDLAYRRLLDAYYLQERPLNSGVSAVARQINMRDNEVEVKAVLEEFWVLTEQGWINRRADFEIEHYQAKRQQASNAGKASAERRINARSTDVQPTNNQEPRTNNQEPITKNQEIKPPIPPKGGSQAISFVTYLENCKQEGCKPIPENSIVFDYAKKVGLPNDFLKLQWLEFKTRYSLPNAKRYRRWDTVFYKSVQGNWFKLWFADKDEYVLTTVGQQAKKANREAA